MSESEKGPFNPEQIAKLEAQINLSDVKYRQGGGGSQLAYLKGNQFIDKANEIFGFGNWGIELLGDVQLGGVPNNEGTVVGHYYFVRVRLSVRGCLPIEEEGVCPVQEGRTPRAMVDAHDMARKGAVTDAMKRALRLFGDQFGNSLYDVEELAQRKKEERDRSQENNHRPAPAGTQSQQPRPAQTAAPAGRSQAASPVRQAANGAAQPEADPKVQEQSYRRRLEVVKADSNYETKKNGLNALLVEMNERFDGNHPVRLNLRPLVNEIKAQVAAGQPVPAPAPVLQPAGVPEEPDFNDFFSDDGGSKPPF
jgi:DNA repair and recombination protein RAD52